MGSPGPSNPDRLECREFEKQLSTSERRLPSPLGSADAMDASLEGLAAHARACSPCRARSGSRLAGVQGFSALRGRAVPDGLLEGVGDRVLARARLGGSGGGMSTAFLDAPQSLARWRQTALAASVLLVLGTGLVATGQLGWRDGSRPAVGDGTVAIPEGMLEAWDTRRTDDPPSDRVQPVVVPTRGSPNYWIRTAGSDHLWIFPLVPPPVPADSPLRSPGGEAPGVSPGVVPQVVPPPVGGGPGVEPKPALDGTPTKGK